MSDLLPVGTKIIVINPSYGSNSSPTKYKVIQTGDIGVITHLPGEGLANPEEYQVSIEGQPGTEFFVITTGVRAIDDYRVGDIVEVIDWIGTSFSKGIKYLVNGIHPTHHCKTQEVILTSVDNPRENNHGHYILKCNIKLITPVDSKPSELKINRNSYLEIY